MSHKKNKEKSHKFVDKEVSWIGSQLSNIDKNQILSHLKSLNVYFYKKCILGPLLIKVDDFVLISNADCVDPDSLSDCYIAKILYLYELDDEYTTKDPCRAIVQWYSRPKYIPQRYFDNDEISIDFDNEVIEDWRSYDTDISIESIFQICSIIKGQPTDNALKLIAKQKKQTNMKTFVCRYKFTKIKIKYYLIPLSSECDSDEIKKINSKRNPNKKTMPEFDFVDVNQISNGNDVVSPFKIMGNCVVKLMRSSIKKYKNSNDNEEIDLKSTPNSKNPTNLNSKCTKVRRNLNISMENDSTDLLNYSIIDNTPDNPKNEIRIKLKLSANQKERPSSSTSGRSSTRFSIDTSLPDISEIVTTQSVHNPSNMLTPSKKVNHMNIIETPTTRRRKSILKTPGSANGKDTPKRTLKLSNIIEERFYKESEIICTPTKDKSHENYPQTPKSRKRIHTVNEVSTPKTPATMTPTQKMKLIRSGGITPSINKREDTSKRRKSDLQKAREQLHVSAIPCSLPCRENEFENIYSFLEDKILDQSGGCMYISGVPGTGKTATTTEVVRCLKYKAQTEEIPAFQFIEINGMRLTEPKQAYVQIYKQLTGKTVSSDQAYSMLEKRFTTSSPHRTTTVLLVDELDILCNRRQDVVYNLLDWPSKVTARLVVITIANTMDLPERLLMGKVTSRLGLTRLTFQPYTHKQLQEIVMSRLSGSDAFKSDAVQLVARKVAAVSGDARRALDICRRATEIAENNNTEKIQTVNMIHVQQALEEMISSAKVQAIKKCSRLEQVFLQAVAAEVSRTGVEETNFNGVYSQIQSISAFMGVQIPSPGIAMKICAKLGSERLLICEHSRADIFQKILLNVSSDDIHYALQVRIE